MKHLEIIPPGLQEFIWLHFNAETPRVKLIQITKHPAIVESQWYHWNSSYHGERHLRRLALER